MTTTTPAALLDALAGHHDPLTVQQIYARVTGEDWQAWERQVIGNGACSHPIRLEGRIWRDGQLEYDTARLPDGVHLAPCNNRRASMCPSCSWLYRGDAWQLLRAGIVGGHKGIPASIATHPELFVTLTAPSFGAVHGLRGDKRCRPRREGTLCRHGRRTWCMRRHHQADDELGQPLCGDCYDYRGHVLFNWWAPELWRRFPQDVHRCLAQRLGYTVKAFKALVRIEYGKVAETQQRGIVHFHAIMRLDDATADEGDYRPPAIPIDVEDFTAAVHEAAARVTYDTPETPTSDVELRFGEQVDVRVINSGIGGAITGEAVAAYISKYQTKGTEAFGLGGRPITATAARQLGLSPHVARIIETCEQLAATVDGLARLLRWTHMLGFRGHVFTKSRRFSTTFGRLRSARSEWRRRQDRIVRGLDPDEEDATLVIGEWTYTGRGYTTNGDAALAASIAAWTREARDLGRLELATATAD
jgi:hypothetical protein